MSFRPKSFSFGGGPEIPIVGVDLDAGPRRMFLRVLSPDPREWGEPVVGGERPIKVFEVSGVGLVALVSVPRR